ncbi:MAG: hypothetical protein ABIF88_02650 [archaeon]
MGDYCSICVEYFRAEKDETEVDYVIRVMGHRCSRASLKSVNSADTCAWNDEERFGLTFFQLKKPRYSQRLREGFRLVLMCEDEETDGM